MSTTYHDAHLGHNTVHYAEGGDPRLPHVVLLHGFPSSSFQFRNLIPVLSKRYHVVAPDLPGFGHSTYDQETALSFDYIASTINELLDHLDIRRYAVYVFDYGAPTAWRLALNRPDSITAIITQNGNAYAEGLSSWWDGLKAWWETGDRHHLLRTEMAAALSMDNVKRQYTFGVPQNRLSQIDPSTWTLDYLNNIHNHEDRQLDLFFDYRTNLDIYPRLHAWFRSHQVPLLAVWGKADEIFPEAGARAYVRDLPDAQVELLDGGHFLLETHLQEVSPLLLRFLDGVMQSSGE
ncbi:hypothetical protein IAU60_006807 [Kwoniella sp. DSM 27419]